MVVGVEGEGGFDGEVVAEGAAEDRVAHHHADAGALDYPAAAEGVDVAGVGEDVV